MLSRAAANLYWQGRYVERADFLIRLLDATLRLANLPSAGPGAKDAWRSALDAGGAAAWGRENPITEADALHHLALDPGNRSSLRSCIDKARANARAVRTALTIEAWEAMNAAYHEMARLRTQRATRANAGAILETVRRSLQALDGAAHKSMLRNEAYFFVRLGAAMERADNTARLLDVKYMLLLPNDEEVGGGLDQFQWATILRTVSALTAYRWVYRESVKPWLVADLLIMNRQMPRSLMSSYRDIVRHLDLLADDSGRTGPADVKAKATLAMLESARTRDIFQGGLHEFIAKFLIQNNDLGSAVAEQYLF